MQVKSFCPFCKKSKRVIGAFDNEGLYVVCRECFHVRTENISKDERKQMINILRPVSV